MVLISIFTKTRKLMSVTSMSVFELGNGTDSRTNGHGASR